LACGGVLIWLAWGSACRGGNIDPQATFSYKFDSDDE
jgi:hypothetical protein